MAATAARQTAQPAGAGTVNQVKLRALLRFALAATAAMALLGTEHAGAHGAEGHDQGPYESSLTGFFPVASQAGLEVQVIDARWVMIVAAPGRSLTVTGYFDDQFLRISDAGTWEMNANSPTAQNQVSFQGDAVTAALPGVAGDNGDLWVPASVGREVIWEDERVRWQGDGLSPMITNPDMRTKLFDWTIPLTLWDGSSAELRGVLYYDPTLGVEHTSSSLPAATTTDEGFPWRRVGGGIALSAISIAAGAFIGVRVIRRRDATDS